MNCSFCGKELKEGAKFCLFCGTKVQQGESSISRHPVSAVSVSKEQSHGSVGIASATEGKTKVKEKKRLSKKKLVIAIVAAVTAIVILCGVGAFALLSAKESQSRAVPAYIHSNGTAYICCKNGKHIKVSGNLKEAYLTPDGKHVVAVEKDGSVFWQKADNDKKNIIAKGTAEQQVEIFSVCNDMFFFTAANGSDTMLAYCHSFDDKATAMITDINKSDSVALSNTMYYSGDEGTVAYAKDGGVYVFDTEEMTSEKISTYSKGSQISVSDVSCDGEAVVWTVIEKDNVAVSYLFLDGTVTELNRATLKNEESAPFYTLNCGLDGSDTFVVASSSSEKIYVRTDGSKSVTTVTLPYKPVGIVYSASGMALRESEDIESKDGFFIPTRDVSSSKSSIIMYYLSENGKHSSLVTGIKDDGNAYKFSGDKLLYIDSSDVAHMATLHKDKDHIATRVQLCEKAVKLIATKEEGELVYVLAKAANDSYDLYRHDMDKHNTALIASKVGYTVLISEDSESVYYFSDVSDTNGTAVGTLFEYRDGKANRIRSSVVISSVTSYLASGELDAEGVWLDVYVGEGSTGYIFDSVFYNGKQVDVRIQNATKK